MNYYTRCVYLWGAKAEQRVESDNTGWINFLQLNVWLIYLKQHLTYKSLRAEKLCCGGQFIQTKGLKFTNL